MENQKNMGQRQSNKTDRLKKGTFTRIGVAKDRFEKLKEELDQVKKLDKCIRLLSLKVALTYLWNGSEYPQP